MLIGGLSSILRKRKDGKKERKNKHNGRKKRKKNLMIEGGKAKQTGRRRENAPVQDRKLKTKRKLICFVERVKKRSERRNTVTLRYGRGRKIVPETDRKTQKKMTDVDLMMQTESETSGKTEELFQF